jgi:hypothetical protein
MSWAFGISVDDKIVGVLTVGKPCSWSATCGVIGEKYADLRNPASRSKDVYELNRLWLSDALPPNMESQFIGWCLRQLRKINPRLILISYADGAQGHVGYVYQATNWIYAGTSTPFKDITFKGVSDYRSVPKEQRGETIGNKRAWASDPNAIRIPRSTKHRYVWFANSADTQLLRWAVQPYPKKVAA